ncbi:peptidyl-prolyl cis-trans isomerase G isoform X2 [Pectinophora gossypiella]|uniref:peptidyl-prolyl cis-trans isomerase G isoform X2 n=1 Tax=Pectinophora gossypiella TaxID=13191 RepID=UPI00214EE9CA|nr:peptidyl-prolyl cis-trans isomerase G isoform X2 [Pectinophora gossypiella]
MTVDGDEKPARDRVFMDISIGGLPSGRIVFELFNDVAPKTAENFRALCAGDMGLGKVTGKPLTYKGMVFHRVVKDFMIQGGDFTNANGTGGESIYGGTFEDETFEIKHDRPYLLSMANRGKDTNGSQFFITTQPAPHLDNVHCVFGQVVSGAALVRQLETLPVDRNARPLQDVAVANCGQLVRLKPGKKRKQDKDKVKSEKEDSEDSDHSHKKEKKKKKDKKEKKKKRQQSSASEEEEESEGGGHPLVVTTKIDPREIPEVPSNRFLMRGGRDPEKDRSDPRRDRERARFRERDRHAYTRSGRIIKGRGVFRYRTPSRSRSRSRSVTPPHWRQAQRRIIKLSEFEHDRQERAKERDHEAQRSRPSERSLIRDEGGTPEPREKEEGECDTTLETSRHEKVDYNALDFEEDMDVDDEDGTHKRRKPIEKQDVCRRERERERRPTPESRAQMLARALGVEPKSNDSREREVPHPRDARDTRDPRDNRESRDTREPRRREGLASAVVYAAPKLSSAVTVSEHQGLAKAPVEEKSKDGYDPFSLLRSTFRGARAEGMRNRMEERLERRDRDNRQREKDKETKERDERRDRYKSDREDRARRFSERDDKMEKRDERSDKKIESDKDKPDKEKFDKRDISRERHDDKVDKRDKSKEMSVDKDKREKSKERYGDKEKVDKRDKSRDRHDERKEERRDRSRDKYDRRDRSRDRHDDKRDKSRDKSDRRDRSRDRHDRRGGSKDRERSDKRRDDRSKSRDDDREDKGKKRRSRSKDRSKSPKPRYSRRSGSREKSRDKSHEKSPAGDDKKKEEQRDEARKELMEIVRLIKSRQKDRENKAAEAKKKKEPASSDSDDDKRRRRRSSDRRKRSESPRRRSSSERHSRRRRSRSGRRSRRRDDRRRSSSSN